MMIIYHTEAFLNRKEKFIYFFYLFRKKDRYTSLTTCFERFKMCFLIENITPDNLLCLCMSKFLKVVVPPLHNTRLLRCFASYDRVSQHCRTSHQTRLRCCLRLFKTQRKKDRCTRLTTCFERFKMCF